MTYICEFDSPIGKILIAEKDCAVTGVWFEGQKFFPGFKESEALFSERNPVLIQAKSWLYRYFSGERPEISELNLSPKGSDFRKEVWKELCKIPYGSTVTYGELANRIAARLNKKNMSARAIGGAVAHNPISIIIPCHRIVGANGRLTGYSGGTSKKLKLLKLEGVNTDKFLI
ncbi:MAG: methylated-DNA--[protein]-cysteine S-methyltransferase [Clostridiales bacterium]|nr:methylated-DNA--[protein]-cysteine S-methyltransferase [Clostridiales bacterium]